MYIYIKLSDGYGFNKLHNQLDYSYTVPDQEFVHMELPKVNIDEPRWDQSTYWGRAKYFFTTTNPMNILCSSKELERAKEIVDKYKWVKFEHIIIFIIVFVVIQLLLNMSDDFRAGHCGSETS